MNRVGDPIWRKASGSTATGSDCVEVATLPGGDRMMRDSKRPRGSILRVTAGAWRAFVGEVKGEGAGL
jgi:hypothetical protein